MPITTFQGRVEAVQGGPNTLWRKLCLATAPSLTLKGVCAWFDDSSSAGGEFKLTGDEFGQAWGVARTTAVGHLNALATAGLLEKIEGEQTPTYRRTYPQGQAHASALVDAVARGLGGLVGVVTSVAP